MKGKIVALFIIAVFFLCLAGAARAHWVRIVAQEITTVENPQVSQAFYGELKGSTDKFKIVATEPFDLYMNIMVPDVSGARKDMSAEIYTGENLPGQEKTGDGTMQIKRTTAILSGKAANWRNFYEPFSRENYLKGPEYKAEGLPLKGVRMEPGTYFVQVFNDENEGKYVLSFGTQEQFSAAESMSALKLMPKISMEFFGKTAVSAYLNLTGLLLLLFVGIFVLFIMAGKKALPRGKGKAEAAVNNEEEPKKVEVKEEDTVAKETKEGNIEKAKEEKTGPEEVREDENRNDIPLDK